MPVLVSNIVLKLDEPESLVPGRAAAHLGVRPDEVADWRIVKRSLDARGRGVRFVHTIELSLTDPAVEAMAVRRGLARRTEERRPADLEPGTEHIQGRPVVAGCGPAGLFAAMKLAEYGYRPLVIERGSPVEQRGADVETFLRCAELDPDSNLLFGAGGAGAYSDGKLSTHAGGGRVRDVLHCLVEAGAPGDILVEGKPHLGTDLLAGTVANLCKRIVRQGGEIMWRCKLTGLSSEDGHLRAVETTRGRVDSNCLVLATGANARDTFTTLIESSLAMEPRPFQMGIRVEHPRELIDRAVFGRYAGHPRLGAVEYVLRGGAITSFCVCPGGVLVAASAEPDTVCTNGMSNRSHDGEFTNTALVATVQPEEFGPGPLAGLEFQRRWEREAFRLGGGDYCAPAQNVSDLIAGALRPLTRQPSYPFGVRPAPLDRVMPDSVCAAIAEALPKFETKIPGFTGQAGIAVGPEARASCPVRIVRDPKTHVSVSLDGVYPTGEGSGYSSGIMSSAVDGLKSAEAVIRRFAVPRG